jgi:hypothetical protein
LEGASLAVLGVKVVEIFKKNQVVKRVNNFVMDAKASNHE